MQIEPTQVAPIISTLPPETNHSNGDVKEDVAVITENTDNPAPATTAPSSLQALDTLIDIIPLPEDTPTPVTVTDLNLSFDTVMDEVDVPPVANPALLKQLSSIINQIKRQKNNVHFLLPVNHALYPTYPDLVKNPMDISKIESKLPRYANLTELLDDVRLIRDNCQAFNGKDAAISHWANQMAKLAERVGSEKKIAPSIATKPVHRPKRDIHAPARDLNMSPTKRSSKKNYPEFKFCARVHREMVHKRNALISWPFIVPVDWATLNIPEYPNVIKYPMDLQTIRERLDQEYYDSSDQFEADIRLMFNNCYAFNKPDDDVYVMGQRFERIFDEKWAEKPAVFDVPKKHKRSKDYSGYSSSDSEADKALLSSITGQIDLLNKQYATTVDKMDRKRKRRDERRRAHALLRRKNKKDKSGNGKANGDWSSDEDIKQLTSDQIPVMTQQQQLIITEGINKLDSEHVHDVLKIIKEGLPDLPGGSDEIELDINTMDRKTQYRLFKYVQRINRPKKIKKQRRDDYSVQKEQRNIQAPVSHRSSVAGDPISTTPAATPSNTTSKRNSLAGSVKSSTRINPIAKQKPTERKSIAEIIAEGEARRSSNVNVPGPLQFEVAAEKRRRALLSHQALQDVAGIMGLVDDAFSTLEKIAPSAGSLVRDPGYVVLPALSRDDVEKLRDAEIDRMSKWKCVDLGRMEDAMGAFEKDVCGDVVLDDSAGVFLEVASMLQSGDLMYNWKVEFES